MDLETKTMTTAAILKAINALPVEERMMIIEQVVHSIRLENSDSPSPSGDSWFDDLQNIAIVKEGIKSANENKGENKGVVLTSKEDIRNYFANL
jgi:hypothetical protein